MALFLLLIYEDESQSPAQSDPRWQALWDAYVALDEAARAAGVLVDSQPLLPSAQAETVVVQQGERRVAGGPFATGRMQLTGYYLLRCADRDEARKWASRIPAASSGGVVEIRQVLEPG